MAERLVSYPTQHDKLEPLMWLYVQSMTGTLSRAGINPPNASPPKSNDQAERLASALCQQLDTTAPYDIANKKIPPPAKVHDKQNIHKAVRFAGALADAADAGNAAFVIAPTVNASMAATATSPPPTLTSDTLHGIKLCRTRTLCHLLTQHKQKICYSGPSRADHCVGYLETPSLHKHVFYLGENRDAAIKRPQRSQERHVISLKELIHRSTEASLPFINQLQLAHKISVAVLQYHSTPWLNTHWRIQDISFLGACDELFEDQGALQTLHLSTEISKGELNELPAPMEGVRSTTHGSTNDAELQELYGIRDMTLGSLGLALLELGFRGTVDSHRRPKEPHDFVTARRLANGRPTPLGPRFQKVVQRCFQCDSEITKPEVQGAVFEDIVCELERMIKVLTVVD